MSEKSFELFLKKTDNWPTDILVYWPTNILTEAVSWESGVQLDPGNMAKFYTGNILYEKKKKKNPGKKWKK